MGEILERVEQLERANRRLGWLVAGFAIVALLPWLVGATVPPQQRALEASSVVLRDAGGHRRASLSVDASGQARLALADGEGRDRFAVATAAGGATTLAFHDALGNPRVRFGSSRDSSLNFYDRRGKLRVALGITEYGPRWASEILDQAVERSKRSGDPFSLPSLDPPSSAAQIEFEGEDGPVLRLFDPQGRPRLEARVDMNRPAIFLQSEQGGLQLLRPLPTPETREGSAPR